MAFFLNLLGAAVACAGAIWVVISVCVQHATLLAELLASLPGLSTVVGGLLLLAVAGVLDGLGQHSAAGVNRRRRRQ